MPEMEEIRGRVAGDRLSYFVETIVKSGLIWTLAEGQAILILGIEGHDKIVPVFPHADFALGWFEESGLEEADLVGVELQSWLEGALEELAVEDIELAVFPTADDEGSYLEPREMLKQLRAAIEGI